MEFFGFTLTLGISALKVHHLHHFPFRHLHEILQLVRCHHQMLQHVDSGLSLDLQAHCSAILVSRLLSVVHLVGFCGLHFSVQVGTENIVLEINTSSARTQNDFSFLDQFCCKSEPCIHHLVPSWNLVALCARSLQHCTTRCVHQQWVFHSEIGSNRFRRILGTAPAPSGQKFNGNVFTVAPVSRFIFTHSNRFGLLMAPRSKPPIENELAELSYVCSPNLRAIQPNSSHHSIRQDSIHHETKNCQWYTDVQIPEYPSLSLISSFSRPDKPVFDVLPLCEPLAHWIAPLVPLDFPSLVLFTLSFALTLGPWLARFAVARRLLSCATVL